MASIDYDELDGFKLDVLREVGNIGAGNAATALAKLLGVKINITIPDIKILNYDKTSKELGGNQTSAVGVSVAVSGDMHGRLLQILQKSFVDKILEAFFRKKIDSLTDLGEMDLSLISEVGNITTAAYVTALADFGNMHLNIHPPENKTDKIGDLLDFGSQVLDSNERRILFIDENFYIEGEEFKSNMILELDFDSIQYLFNNLGIK